MALGKADIMLTKTPESQNLSSARLNAAVTRIADGVYGEIDSLLVIRNNHLVLEKYFSPQYYGREYRYPVRSVTKSIASALIGIAIDQGKIKSVQSNLLAIFQEYQDLENPDSRKNRITLEHVLTMTAGFQWNESIVSYGDPRNDYNRMARSPDWIKVDRLLTRGAVQF
jgi:CubicO group peptidase (beta-lactamase class C family)